MVCGETDQCDDLSQMPRDCIGLGGIATQSAHEHTMRRVSSAVLSRLEVARCNYPTR